MERPRYYSLEESLDLVDEPNRTKCKQVLQDNQELFRVASLISVPGSYTIAFID